MIRLRLLIGVFVQKIMLFFTLFSCFAFLNESSCRSPLRRPDPLCPVITTRWTDGKKLYRLRDSHLEVNALFHLYDEAHFMENLLPMGELSFRNDPSQSVKGKEISELVEGLLKEIKNKKKKYTNFTILKKRDFNVRKQAGLLIVKCTKYPFVVKLFMETPRSFIRPYNKGFEPACFFIIGGGATRHFIGFTRIKNMHVMRKRLKNNPHWSKRIDIPRKWFWLPKDAQRKMELTGYNIGGHKKISIEVPAIYAVITDEIKVERKFSIFDRKDRRTAIDLCNFLLCRIDPHIENFLVEKETGKIVIIDTEHFPSLVGFKKRPRITRYTSWYLHLVAKFIKDRYFRTKRDRHNLQLHPVPPFSMP
jgi:hypothetical protein